VVQALLHALEAIHSTCAFRNTLKSLSLERLGVNDTIVGQLICNTVPLCYPNLQELHLRKNKITSFTHIIAMEQHKQQQQQREEKQKQKKREISKDEIGRGGAKKEIAIVVDDDATKKKKRKKKKVRGNTTKNTTNNTATTMISHLRTINISENPLAKKIRDGTCKLSLLPLSSSSSPNTSSSNNNNSSSSGSNTSSNTNTEEREAFLSLLKTYPSLSNIQLFDADDQYSTTADDYSDDEDLGFEYRGMFRRRRRRGRPLHHQAFGYGFGGAGAAGAAANIAVADTTSTTNDDNDGAPFMSLVFGSTGTTTAGNHNNTDTNNDATATTNNNNTNTTGDDTDSMNTLTVTFGGGMFSLGGRSNRDEQTMGRQWHQRLEDPDRNPDFNRDPPPPSPPLTTTFTKRALYGSEIEYLARINHAGRQYITCPSTPRVSLKTQHQQHEGTVSGNSGGDNGIAKSNTMNSNVSSSASLPINRDGQHSMDGNNDHIDDNTNFIQPQLWPYILERAYKNSDTIHLYDIIKKDTSAAAAVPAVFRSIGGANTTITTTTTTNIVRRKTKDATGLHYLIRNGSVLNELITAHQEEHKTTAPPPSPPPPQQQQSPLTEQK